MGGTKEEGTRPGNESWTPHTWTPEEITAAFGRVKQQLPAEVWTELERLERSTGDLTDAPAAGRVLVTLFREYEQNFDRRDIIRLYGLVRAAHRAALGLD